MENLFLDTFTAPGSLLSMHLTAGLPAALESAPVEPLEADAVSITALAPEIQIAVGMACLLFLFLSLLPLLDGEKQFPEH